MSRIDRSRNGWLPVVVASLLLGLFPLAGRSIAGQQQTSIVGVVTDESGAMLPGVTVTATSPALQVPSVTTVTDERGEYRLTPLPIGTLCRRVLPVGLSDGAAGRHHPDGRVRREDRHVA